MKIAIVSEYNKFSSTGGTENYVDFLINGLLKKGHEVLFVTLGSSNLNNIEQTVFCTKNKAYQLFLVKQSLFNSNEIKQKNISYTWGEIYPKLMEFSPHIIHVHTLSTFFNIKHIEICKKIFKNIVFTSHIPAHFCPTGQMIKYGKTPCNGKLSNQCDLCLIKSDFKNIVSGIYRNKKLIKSKLIQTLQKLEIQMICVSEWQKEQLILNGFPFENISVIRQVFIPKIDDKKYSLLNKENNHVLTIGYLGRLSKEKGVDLLFQVLNHYKNDANIHFRIAIPKGVNPQELNVLKALATDNNNIVIDYSIDESTKSSYFSMIDFLFIPSYFIETGPIVLLEGVYFQKTVLAPNIGGPLEFSMQYPEYVKCYEWNNIKSVISNIESLRINENINIRKKYNFETEAINFIEPHVKVYEKLINRLL